MASSLQMVGLSTFQSEFELQHEDLQLQYSECRPK